MVDQKKLARLRQLITEGLRVQLGGELITYIDGGHALPDVSARQNHAIFARRGCGKTLLLHDSAESLGSDVRAIYLNCEDFKQHTFPNVLIEILSALFLDLDSHFSGWFGRKKQMKLILQGIIIRLKEMQSSPDQHEESVKLKNSQEDSSAQSSSDGANLGLTQGPFKVGMNGKSAEESSKKSKGEIEREFKTHQQKLQQLDLWLPELKKQIREFFSLSSKVKTIFLQVDDLYHLRRTDQAFVVDYIHRLCKDVPIFFKIATIRHASTLYADREGQPIGAQERHDFQPINIDYSFSDFDLHP